MSEQSPGVGVGQMAFKLKLLCLVIGLLSTGCSQGMFGLGGSALQSSANVVFATSSNPYQVKALTILQNNCIGCHGTSASGGLSDITNPSNLIAGSWVVAGQPGQSKIYLAVTGAGVTLMPIGAAALPPADIQTIQSWIVAMANAPPPPAPTPTPTPTPSSPSCTFNGVTVAAGSTVAAYKSAKPLTGQMCAGIVENRLCKDNGNGTSTLLGSNTFSTCTDLSATVTYASLNANLFQPKCVGCHSGANGSGGYGFDTFANLSKAVNTASPAMSVVYTSTTQTSNRMPLGGTPLTAMEQLQLLTWIQQGAKNN